MSRCGGFRIAVRSIVIFLLAGCAGKPATPGAGGPWLGQALPGTTAALFAPGIVSTGAAERDVATTPDDSEIYFCRTVGSWAYSAIMVTRLVDGRWTDPEVAPFSGNAGWLDFEPCISPDGSRFLFLSTRPDTAAGETEPGDQDIWIMDRTETGWSEPRNAGEPVNTAGAEFFPSVTVDGTLYFNRRAPGERVEYVMRARSSGEGWEEPERLTDEVNAGENRFNAFIAPDESYIIVCVVGGPDNRGRADYYVSFRNADDSWTGPFNLGDEVNDSGGSGWSPYVSRDGRLLFFMSSRRIDEPAEGRFDAGFLDRAHGRPGNGSADIWWIGASVIESVRPERKQ